MRSPTCFPLQPLGFWEESISEVNENLIWNFVCPGRACVPGRIRTLSPEPGEKGTDDDVDADGDAAPDDDVKVEDGHVIK